MANINNGTVTAFEAQTPGGEEAAVSAVLSLRVASLAFGAIRNEALERGAVTTLLPYLRPDMPPSVLVPAAQAFSNFCRRGFAEPPVRLELVAPGLPALRDLLHHTHSSVLQAVCAAIANVTHGPGGHIGAVQAVSDLTVRLVALLHQDSGVNVRQAALGAVANMLAGTSAQVERCIYAGCLDYIVALLQSNNLYVMEEAARATANIFTHTRATEKALEVGILTPLQYLLNNGDDTRQKEALKTISALFNRVTAAQRDRVLSSGILQPYCAALTRPDRTLAALVVPALTALVQAAEKDDFEETIRKASDSDKDDSGSYYDDSDSEDSDSHGSDSGDIRKVNYLYLKLSEIDVLGNIEQLLLTDDIDENIRHKAQELSEAIRWYGSREDIILEEGKIYTLTEIILEAKSADLEKRLRGTRAARRILHKAGETDLPRLRSISDTMMTAGILVPVIAALDDGVCLDLQNEATWVISILSRMKKHKKAVIERKVIPKLVAFLANKGQVAIPAAEALGSLAVRDSRTRDTILETGALEHILPNMIPDTPLSRLTAYMSFYEKLSYRHVKKGPDNVARLMAAVPRMPALLGMESPLILENACKALSRLIDSSDERTELVQATPGLVSALISLFEHSTTKVQKAAMYTYIKMCCRTDSQTERYPEAGALDSVANLLRSSNPLIVHHAVWIVGCILSRQSSIKLVLEKGIHTVLVDILTGGQLRCQMKAAWAISLIFSKGLVEQNSKVIACGILERCSTLLATDSNNSAEKLRKKVCFLVSVICGLEKRRDAVQVTPGLVQHVVALLGHGAPKLQKAALLTVAAMLDGTDALAEQCFDAGCIHHIKRLLQSSDSVMDAACATSAILKNPAFIQKALDEDILTPLLEVLPSSNVICQETAATAIANLCEKSSEAQHAYVMSRGVMERCFAILETICDTTPTQDYPLNVISPLCRTIYYGMKNNSIENIEAVQAIPGLIACLVGLLKHESIFLQEVAVLVLAVMLQGSATQAERCFDAGFLDHGVRLLQSDVFNIMNKVSNVFGYIILSKASHLRNSILEKDVLTALQGILRSNKIYYQEKAIYVVSTICKSGTPAQCNQILTRGVLEPFCNLLAKLADHSAIAVNNIIIGLDNLLQINDPAFDRKDLRTQLRNYGIRSQLDTLSKHKNEAVKTAATGLIEKYFEF